MRGGCRGVDGATQRESCPRSQVETCQEEGLINGDHVETGQVTVVGTSSLVGAGRGLKRAGKSEGGMSQDSSAVSVAVKKEDEGHRRP